MQGRLSIGDFSRITHLSVYDNELFTDERGRLVVYVPVAQPTRSGRVQLLVIEPTDVAVTVHRGAHEPISSAPRTPPMRTHGAPRSGGRSSPTRARSILRLPEAPHGARHPTRRIAHT